MNEQTLARLRNRWKMYGYFLLDLPGAFFFGLRIKSIDLERSVVQVPYRWSTKNPFQSIYFAALSAAAELSTGILALAAVEGKSMSMLVTKVQGEFLKKARGIIFFECNDVAALMEAVEFARTHEQGSNVTLQSTGKNEQGEVVAVFNFQWSFRKKPGKGSVQTAA
ncbi:MAG: DUF4442 domain-containing protein [Saprospiraceae bacterium]|nr:DUF4442 domain-containing protein [Saprospiraceae bacterium]